MPNNWKTYKLDEVLEIKNGKSKPKEIGKIPIYGGNGILGYTSKVNNDSQVIIIGRVGAYCGSVYYEDKPVWISDNAMSAKVKDNGCNQFFYYLLKKMDLNSFAGGSSQPLLTQSTLNSIKVRIPPLPEQKAIANILSAIDDKIENNLAINKTLEDMAMALYKHWFVDFGPFQGGEFVDSELGRIPKGWEVKKLGDLVEKLSKGTTPRMKDIVDLECAIPFLKVKDISSEGQIDTTGLSFIPESIHLNQLKRSILEKGDLLFSIAGTIGRVSIITGILDNSNCNQALAFIRLHNKSKYNTLIYNWLKSSEVQEEIKTSIVQGVQANVSLTVLKELQLAIPFDNIMFEFSKKLNPIHDLILDNQSENKSLTKLRDTLLPKLISGEVRLKAYCERVTNEAIS